MKRPDLGHARLAAALILLGGKIAAASTCPVPDPVHPNLAAAVRDLSCTTIQLAAGTYPENLVVARDVVLAGAGAGATVVAGAIEVSGATTDVALDGLALDGTGVGVAGCWQSLLAATGGARLQTAADLLVTNSGIANGACRIFADGFESAGVLAWSAASP